MLLREFDNIAVNLQLHLVIISTTNNQLHVVRDGNSVSLAIMSLVVGYHLAVLEYTYSAVIVSGYISSIIATCQLVYVRLYLNCHVED